MGKNIWWGAAILWCLMIAFATRNPFFTGDSTGDLLSNFFFDSVILNIILRKAGHMVAFGVLAVFCWLALPNNKYRYVIAWLLATFYGAVDEWHQSYIPNRDGIFTDVLYNSAGAFLAMIFVMIVVILLKRRRKYDNAM